MFLRLAGLNPVVEEAKLREIEEDAREADIRMNVSSKEDAPKSPMPADEPQETPESDSSDTKTATTKTIETPQPEPQPSRSAASSPRPECSKLHLVIETCHLPLSTRWPTFDFGTPASSYQRIRSKRPTAHRFYASRLPWGPERRI